MSSSIDTIVEVLREHIPNLSLRDPATPEQIAETEQKIGVRFPPELANLYLQHDGEDWSDTICLMAGANFMSLEQIVTAHEIGMYTLTLDDEPDVHPCLPENSIRSDTFCQGWIPFAGSHTGNYLAVDTTPGELGTVGQIITFGVDEEYRCRVAANFVEFFEMTLVLYSENRCHPRLNGEPNNIYDVVYPQLNKAN